MYQSILVPIDLSFLDRGKAMIDIAIKQSNPDSKIVLLYVIEAVPGWALAEMPEGILEKSEQSAMDQLSAIANTTAGKAIALVRRGHPAHMILSVADEMATELIIIASHKPGLQDYFLGSTASKIVRHAKCSVLVVR